MKDFFNSLGYKQTFRRSRLASAMPPEADITARNPDGKLSEKNCSAGESQRQRCGNHRKIFMLRGWSPKGNFAATLGGHVI
jgi:hypothetical protein